jgi:hypothetical protein
VSRNVHFISELMEHKGHFVVVDLGRGCDKRVAYLRFDREHENKSAR